MKKYTVKVRQNGKPEMVLTWDTFEGAYDYFVGKCKEKAEQLALLPGKITISLYENKSIMHQLKLEAFNPAYKL